MKQQIAEWLWRAAVLCALGWIGVELRQIHEDLIEPADEVTASAPDDVQSTIDDLNEDVAKLNDKVDAIMAAMMQLKR
jgi:predicted transcriptional regulator